MDIYLRLQQDKAKGNITQQQYKEALVAIKFQKKKKSRQSKQTAPENTRRTHLRTLTKWFFDVELDRIKSPLYLTTDNTESIVLAEFIKLANKVISYASNHPLLASSNREELTSSIFEIVKNRRKNIKNSKKDGIKRQKRLRLIYFYKKQLLVTGPNGNQIVIQPPSPLPLPKDAASPTPVTTPPALSPIVVSKTPARVKTKPNPVPPVSTTTMEAQKDDDSDSDFDILDLQEKLHAIQKRIATVKKQKKKKKPSMVDNKPWLVNMAMANAKPPRTTQTCRNADCGREFVVEDAEDQNGDPVLCNTCWDMAKEDLKSITSTKGARRPKKRKSTKNAKKVVKKHKSKAQSNRPGTPPREKRLRRTTTPPNPKRNKFEV